MCNKNLCTLTIKLQELIKWFQYQKLKIIIRFKKKKDGNINFEIGLNPRSNGISFSQLILLFFGKNLFKLKAIRHDKS